MEDEKIIKEILKNREGMKKIIVDNIISDQQQGVLQPPLTKTYAGSKEIILSKNFENVVKNNDFLKLLDLRSSKRKYSGESISLDELSFLLWATQGVKQIIGNERKATLRTVPSAGSRHPFETYIIVNNVDGLEQGLYHYLALEHKLEYIKEINDQESKIKDAFGNQIFVNKASVMFIWTVIPYRCEWRYSLNAHKYSLLDAGHICQNLYLACEAISLGTCAIGAYNQELIDNLLELDAKLSKDDYDNNEFVVYAASVGRAKF